MFAVSFVAVSLGRAPAPAGWAAEVSEPIPNPQTVYRRASPAVVGVTCRGPSNGRYFGTGTIVDSRGVVLTSTSVVPEGASRIRIYLRGGRVLTAKPVRLEKSLEFALLRIESDETARFPAVTIGRSAAVRLGESVYTLGNAFESIQRDDQVVMASGLVSGLFRLAEARSEATHTGAVIETDAPVNNGMDGGPLLGRRGQLIGVLSLNYSTSRWLGTAIPIDTIRHLLREHVGEDVLGDGTQLARAEGRPVPEARIAPTGSFLGLRVEDSDARTLRILAVDPHSPAAEAALRSGTFVLEIDGAPVPSAAEFRRRLKAKHPGESVELKTRAEGKERVVKILLWGKF